MSQTIKISDREVEILRAEAPLHSRSLAGQAEHWLRLGRAIEQSPNFSYRRVTDALKGLVDPDDLTMEEGDIFLEEFSQSLETPSPESIAFFDDRKKRGVGVGLDENDNIVYQQPESY